MYVLGISCFYHDAAAALLKDGVLIAAAEEERFTRKKHDSEFPTNAINFCLQTAGITTNDLAYVTFYEKPFLKFERILLTTLSQFPWAWRLFKEAMAIWLPHKLWIRGIISHKLDIDDDKILFIEHHLSHAASAYLCSSFDDAAVLTVDGVGEWCTATLGTGTGNQLNIIKEMRFPHSLGLLYSTFTAFLGFEVNEGEYKVMGMAPYGTPRYVDKIHKLVDVKEDGSLHVNMDYFSYHYSHKKMFNGKFERLFGKPRSSKINFFTPSTGYPSYFGEKPSNYEELGKLNQHYADIAASIQAFTEDVLLKMANYLYKETGKTKLCMAGGVALNCSANGRLLRESPFEEIYIQPAAGDGGGALGAALYTYYTLLNNERKFVMEHAYWGKEYNEGDIKSFLDDNGIKYQYCNNEDELVSTVTDSLQEGKVVGWFQGRFEWGPRALGNRSILADPRREDMKDIVNTKIKFREPYRPFAPSVLVEKTHEFFNLEEPSKRFPARFMLYIVTVKDDKKDVLPAITHVDGTARPQTVNKKNNPLYYKLIDSFGAATGVPVVLNTSFNLKGEPVVNTPADAYSTFMRSGIDLLVMGNFTVKKE
jgi:carbamoyltransferase